MSERESTPFPSIERLLSDHTAELKASFGVVRTQYEATYPLDLPEEDEVVSDAFEDHAEWEVEVDGAASRFNTAEARIEASYLKSVFFAEAGFTDKRYLADVLDWIDQDEQRASESGYSQLSSRIRAKIQELVAVLES